MGNATKSTANKKNRTEFRVMPSVSINPQHRRPCDGCTACCAVYPIEEVQSPAFVPCQYLGKTGCGIFGTTTRPPVCHTFLCEWAQGNAPAWMKPNQCGVIPVHTAGNKAMHLREVWPGASDAESVRQFIRHSNTHGIHVVVTPHPGTIAAPDAAGEETVNVNFKNRVYLATGEVREFEGADFASTFIAPQV